MAKILLVWELGGGYGHIMKLQPIAHELRRRGHDVAFVAKTPDMAAPYYEGIRCLEAPNFRPPREEHIADPGTFAQIMHNVGCTDSERFGTITRAWRAIFEAEKPDVAVLDYSPRAQVALQGMPTRVVMIGLGFFCPPDVSPMKDLRPWMKRDPAALAAQEQQILERFNEQIVAQGAEPLPRVASLFTRADACFLSGLPELDHYRERQGGDYIGTWTYDGGETVTWPKGDGPRIFGYLRPFQALAEVLNVLRRSNARCVFYISGVPREKLEPFVTPRLQFTQALVNVRQMAQECDAAVLNMGHGTLCQMLMAGKPIFGIPMQLEQFHLAESLMTIGAGLCMLPNAKNQAAKALTTVMTDRRYTACARAFARKYADYDPQAQITRVVDRIEALAAAPVR